MGWEKDYTGKIKGSDAACIYIYGAGQAAGYVYEVCSREGIRIDGFAISGGQENKQKEKEGLPVVHVSGLLERKGLLLLIGAVEKNRYQMLRFLAGQGFQNYIDIPDGIYGMNPWLALKKTPSMEITPSVGCSIRCRYCPQKLFVSRYYEGNPHRPGKMSFDQYRTCLDKLPEDTFIEFSGFVEPFLNPESIDMMEYTHRKGYRLSLFTTLTGLDRDGFERIRDIPFERVVLHAPDQEGYADIPVTDRYLEVLGSVLHAKRADGTGFVTAVNCQGTPAEKFMQVLAGSGPEVTCSLHDRAGNLMPDTKLAGAERTGRIFCSSSHNLNRNVLLPDGSVVLCCNDFGMQHVLGNLLLDEYDRIMHGEEMRRIRRAMNLDMSEPLLCRKCFFAGEME